MSVPKVVWSSEWGNTKWRLVQVTEDCILLPPNDSTLPFYKLETHCGRTDAMGGDIGWQEEQVGIHVPALRVLFRDLAERITVEVAVQAGRERRQKQLQTLKSARRANGR